MADKIAFSLESSFAKPSRGQSFAQALSVYDMSPDTMQRMIEERHRHQGYDHHSEQDTAFFSSVGGTYTSTAREHSTGCINNNNNTTTTSTSSAGSLVGKSAASSYAKRSAPAKASPAPQHHFSSAPAPASALLVGAGAGVERGSLLGVADSHGDLEMGKVLRACFIYEMQL